MTRYNEIVKNNILELRAKRYTSSQATLIGITRTFGTNLNEEQLKAMSIGFAGAENNAYAEGPWAALYAGIIAIGIYVRSERSTILTTELITHFKNKEETNSCGNLTDETDYDYCTKYCIRVEIKVVELLEKENSYKGTLKIHD